MTVKQNLERIIHLEDDVKDLDERVGRLEGEFSILMTKLDMVIKMGRITLGLVAAALGLDLGISGGLV